MTRQKAAEICQSIKFILDKADYSEEVEEALEMAIEALEQQPIIYCKDCKYWQDNNNGYPVTDCRWNKDETPDADDFCSFAERK